MKFYKSTDVEKFLDGYGVEYRYDDRVAIDAIDHAASIKNQARHVPLDRDHVRAIHEAAQRDVPFPPVILYHGPRDRYVVIDGNHRVQEVRDNGAGIVSAYIVSVETSMETVMDMTMGANPQLNGKGADDDDRRRHAIALVDRGHTYVQAALIVGVKKDTVTKWARAERAKRGLRARKVRPTVINALSDTRLLMEGLDRHIADEAVPDDVLHPLVEFVATAPTNDAVAEALKLIGPMIAQPEEALAALEGCKSKAKAPHRKPSGKSTTPSEFAQFMMHARAIVPMSPERIMATAPPDRRNEIADLALDLRITLGKLMER